MTDVVPLLLPPNQPPARPYRGGAGILALRGSGSTDDHVPEDFVASVTTTFGSDTTGLTTLPDGRTLREAIAADPEAWLGAAHVETFGADPALLVKLLDTGERLFAHFHPDAAFAAAHLGQPRGKTEARLITSTGASPTAEVWLGFRQPVAASTLAEWVSSQDVPALLDSLVPLTVRAGDWVHVPAGTPHAIGQGITLVELQEPSDLSILLEYAGFPLDPAGAFLGLGLDEALGGLEPGVVGQEAVARLHGAAPTRGPGSGPGESPLLPSEAAAFFSASSLLVTPEAPLDLDRGYGVLVVTDGSGTLAWAGGSLDLTRGSVVLVPFAADAVRLTGSLSALRARPPAPVRATA
ncbi:class I mannose-6-phosphate isomerase [Frondihabitans australicus]|uniref:Mannose-6-phosphate isomerase n=1 Tax=Frondihabitans australicus TaxID=386892 RepID=A0A495IGQ5_9MICO|nr:class I mannose-6-phosphate isomerase [Frondihabitans australicus]RKR75167.1 mannose-6-phosphate isomerase [Frondihabitans australicus]